jgi:flagellar hook assembly protein FlgD
VTLVLEVPGAAAAEIELLDLAGRRLRAFHRPAAGAGAFEVSWDGTDERGRAVPAGLYFARARAGQHEARTRFAFVR